MKTSANFLYETIEGIKKDKDIVAVHLPIDNSFFYTQSADVEQNGCSEVI